MTKKPPSTNWALSPRDTRGRELHSNSKLTQIELTYFASGRPTSRSSAIRYIGAWHVYLGME